MILMVFCVERVILANTFSTPSQCEPTKPSFFEGKLLRKQIESFSMVCDFVILAKLPQNSHEWSWRYWRSQKLDLKKVFIFNGFKVYKRTIFRPNSRTEGVLKLSRCIQKLSPLKRKPPETHLKSVYKHWCCLMTLGMTFYPISLVKTINTKTLPQPKTVFKMIVICCSQPKFNLFLLYSCCKCSR